MSDKKLLEESTIRRFQALANIKPIDVLEEGKKSKSEHEKGESAAEEKAEHGKGHKSEKKEKKLKEAEQPKPAGGRKTSSAMKPEDSEKRASGKELEEMFMGEAEGEEAGGEADMGDMGADMGGDTEAGGEGGDDVKPEVEELVGALNKLLSKVGKKDLEVDVEAGAEGGEGEEVGGEGGAEEEEEGAVMEAKKKKKEEEEESVYESLDLQVEDDEAIAEELTRRVAARLVAEMKRAKKSGSSSGKGWLSKPGKATPARGHGPSKKPFGTKGKGY